MKTLLLILSSLFGSIVITLLSPLPFSVQWWWEEPLTGFFFTVFDPFLMTEIGIGGTFFVLGVIALGSLLTILGKILVSFGLLLLVRKVFNMSLFKGIISMIILFQCIGILYYNVTKIDPNTREAVYQNVPLIDIVSR